MEKDFPKGSADTPDDDLLIFKTLGDETRLAIFQVILSSTIPMNVSEITQSCGKKTTTVSEALGDLKKAKLVHSTRKGKFRLYSANTDRFQECIQRLLNLCR